MDDRHGRPVLVTIAKIEYAVTSAGVALLAHPPAGIRLADEYHGGTPFSSIKYPSDAIDEKPGTDVIVVGTAIPPEGRAVTEMTVSVRVGRLFKEIHAYGTRVYQQTVFGTLEPGPAQPLAPTPIRYELAFGGVDDSEPGRLIFDRKNPAGMGFAELRHKRVGAPAPRLAISRSLLDQNHEPAGFGALSAFWSPRLEHAGTRDDAWQRTRSPIAPTDFDPRHNAVAHPDLYSPTPLRPDEPVEIVGMTLEGIWRFRLPDVAPLFSSVREGVHREHETHLDTFLIDADEQRVELVFRTAIPLPRKAQLLERVTVRVTGELPASVRDAQEAA